MIRRRLRGSGSAPLAPELHTSRRHPEDLRKRRGAGSSPPAADARDERGHERDQRGRTIAGEREQHRGLPGPWQLERRGRLVADVEAEAGFGRRRRLDHRPP
jgi:hypothetical protein